MAKISPELERRYSHELTDTLDRIDSLKLDLKSEVRERKGEIASLDKAAWRLRMLLKGKEVEQTEIPGSEIPSTKPRRTGLAGVLDEAKRVGDRKGREP